MLPSSEIRWLRSSAIFLALLAALLTLMTLAARHALVEVWPPRIHEWILDTGELIFQPATAPRPDRDVLAGSRPHSLLSLEWPGGRVEHGYLLHREPASGRWWIEFATGPAWVDLAELHRHYAPNAMSFAQRVSLLADRLRERRTPAATAPAARAGTDSDWGEELPSESDEF